MTLIHRQNVQGFTQAPFGEAFLQTSEIPSPNIFGQACSRIKNPVIAMNTRDTVSQNFFFFFWVMGSDTNHMGPTFNVVVRACRFSVSGLLELVNILTLEHL